MEKPEGKKLRSIKCRFCFFAFWTRHKSVCRRRYSCAQEPKGALLYITAALHQAYQFCLVIVKGTTDQEVPVVTATVFLSILVWSLFYVNASLFAFCVKRPGVTCRTLGKCYGQRNLTPLLVEYRLYWLKYFLFSSTTATRSRGNASEQVVTSPPTSLPIIILTYILLSYFSDPLLSSFLPRSFFPLCRLYASYKSHNAILMPQSTLQYCTRAPLRPTCEL